MGATYSTNPYKYGLMASQSRSSNFYSKPSLCSQAIRFAYDAILRPATHDIASNLTTTLDIHTIQIVVPCSITVNRQVIKRRFQHLHNTFRMTFKNQIDSRRVLTGGSWSFGNSSLVLEQPQGVHSIVGLRFDTKEFKVQLNSLKYEVFGAWLLASSLFRGCPASNMRGHSDEFFRHNHDMQDTVERTVMDLDNVLVPPLVTANATLAANSIIRGILLGLAQQGKAMKSLT
ncbi:hypothetical protein ACOSQ2_017482 [Xanthoceras sorbifolium]